MKNAISEEHTNMVEALAATIQNRWRDAQLEPCAGDIARAGLAALVVLEMALDPDTPLVMSHLILTDAGS